MMLRTPTISGSLVALTSALCLAPAPAALGTPCDHTDYTIECGDTISVPMPSLTQVMEDYSGFAYGYDAGEYVLEWTAPAGLSQLDVIHSSAQDHAVFLMGPNSCDTDDAGWWDDTGHGTITSGLNDGSTYYLSVDAEVGIPWDSWVHVSFMCDLAAYEFCGGGGDEDGDGLEDCDDPNCTNYYTCIPTENCTNTVDDNGDGLIDCDDPLCFSYLACHPEDCTNGVDDNGDGLVDCDDDWCIFQGVCPETDCEDGVDNDADGLADCQDPDCPSYPCPDEDCTNGIDDNLDGWTDCDDVACYCEPVCWGGEDCGDGVDNDGDGALDCLDCECYTQSPCTGEICDNGIDDEGDSFIDCDDPECEDYPDCGESEAGLCNDFVDNDLDGLTDCDDPDCEDDPFCTGLCDIVETLTCGQTFVWQAIGNHHTDIFGDHSACGVEGTSYNPETSFELPHSDTIEVTVTTLTGDIETVVLFEDAGGAACGIDLTCTAFAGPGETLTYQPAHGSSLYAVIESNGYDAEYEITVTCQADAEECGEEGDADGDGLGNCEDPDCDDYAFPDEDNDGYDICSDCYDGDPDVNPGAPDTSCDNVDQNCDGMDGEPEDCSDGVDNDCDGVVDMDDTDCATSGDDDTSDCEDGCCCGLDDEATTRGRAGRSLAILGVLIGLVFGRRNGQGRTE